MKDSVLIEWEYSTPGVYLVNLFRQHFGLALSGSGTVRLCCYNQCSLYTYFPKWINVS